MSFIEGDHVSGEEISTIVYKANIVHNGKVKPGILFHFSNNGDICIFVAEDASLCNKEMTLLDFAHLEYRYFRGDPKDTKDTPCRFRGISRIGERKVFKAWFSVALRNIEAVEMMSSCLAEYGPLPISH